MKNFLTFNFFIYPHIKIIPLFEVRGLLLMKSQSKTYLQFLVYVSISALLLYFAFQKINWRDLEKAFWGANLFWVGVSCGLALLSHFIRAYRWNMLLESTGHTPTLLQSFWAVMVGYFMNFLFIRVGEVSRCVALEYQAGVPTEKGFGTVIIERITDLLITLLLMITLLLVEFDYFYTFFLKVFSTKFQAYSLNFFIVVGISFLIMGIVFWGVYWQYKKEKLFAKNNHQNNETTKKTYYTRFLLKILYYARKIYKGLLEGLQSIQKLKNPLLFWILSVFIWFLYYLMGYCLFFCFPQTQHLDAWFGFVLLVIGTIGMSAPVQGGFGAYHWLVAGIFALRNISLADGLILATFMHAVQSVFVIVLGGIASIMVMTKRIEN